MLTIVNLLLAYAISFAIGGCAAMLLPMRRPVLYWAVVASQISVSMAKYAVSFDIAPMNIAFFVFYFAVVPLLFWDAAFAIRALCASLVLAFSVALEVALGVCYYYLGYTVGRLALGEDVWLLLLRLGYIAIFIILGVALSPYTRRPARTALASTRMSAALIATLLLQGALLVVLMYAPLLGGVQDYRLLFREVPAVVASMVAMLVGLRSLRRSAGTHAARAAVREYEERLETYLATMRAQIGAAEDAARFRHDHRNHLTWARRPRSPVPSWPVVSAKSRSA